MVRRKAQDGITRAGDTDIVQSLLLTRSEQRLLETAADIQSVDPIERAFMARQLVLCTLPHSDPGNVTAWGRANGNFAFAIQPGVDAFTCKSLGVPYGTLPRLLLYWVTTEAVRTKTPVLELGDTLSQFMRTLGLDPSRGGKRSDAYRLREQASRLFSATITFQYRVPATRLDMKIGRSQLWWNPQRPDQAALWGSRIELTAEFFAAVTAAPVPLDTRALRALRRSPLALDLYSLLTYRAFIATRKNVAQPITWSDLQKQFGADYSDLKDFRKKVAGAVRKVRTVLPGLKLDKAPGGFIVLPGSQPAVCP